jgi:hypothetical protein
MARKLWIMALGITLVGSIFAGAAGPRRVQITGEITAVDSVSQQIVVGDVTVQVTPDTALTMGVDSAIGFDDLAVGMTVKVCGKWDGAVLVAERVNVMYGGK